MYIDGRWVNAVSRATFFAYNPSNGEKIGEAADGNQDDARQAIEAAHGAFGTWSGLTAYQRSEYLYMAYQLMMEHKEHLAQFNTVRISYAGMRKRPNGFTERRFRLPVQISGLL